MELRKLFEEREYDIRNAMLNDGNIADRYKACLNEIEALLLQPPHEYAGLWERYDDLTVEREIMENEAFFKAGFKIATNLLLESI